MSKKQGYFESANTHAKHPVGQAHLSQAAGPGVMALGGVMKWAKRHREPLTIRFDEEREAHRNAVKAVADAHDWLRRANRERFPDAYLEKERDLADANAWLAIKHQRCNDLQRELFEAHAEAMAA